MKPVVIYGIIAVIVVVVISYLYATRASEAYIDQPFNLIVVDANGNMSAVAVRPPSLNGVPPTSNVVYTDALGNLGVMTVGDIYTSYQGNASTKIRNLLTIDGNNNLSTLPTHNFSPCHINGDPNTNPNATINGTPQRDDVHVSQQLVWHGEGRRVRRLRRVRSYAYRRVIWSIGRSRLSVLPSSELFESR